jgi:Tol biopolymer transport system component/DNA-binding winged helix-turn-helix (wHTH) protein
MSRAVTALYEFGPFRVDLEQRVFTREHQVLPLPPKTFDLLVLLVQSPRRAFSKQELLSSLWPDTFVEEANLSFQISVLRKALGEDGARWVETVPKHGYRFSADVRATIPSGTSSAEPLSANEPSFAILKRSTRKVWLAGATVTAALLAVVAFLTVGREPRTAAVRTSPALAVPLTAYPGHERAPSLSPDGSRVAFSWNGQTQDNYDIYVKLAGPGEPARLTTSPAPDDWPAWSPDGRFIAFIRFASPNEGADLVVMPGHGGAERTIATIFPMPIPRTVRQVGNLSWTPDGRWLAFGGATSHNGPRGIWLIAVDGSEKRRLTEAPGGHDLSPVVSPDGRYLAFLRTRTVGRVAIFLVPLTSGPAPSGTPRQLTDDDHAVIGLAWTPDGRDLVFSAGGHLGISRTARISAAPQSSRTPEPEFLPFGEQATAISIAATGRLVYSAQFRDTALYELALPGPPASPVALAAFSSTFDEQTPHYSPDGQRLAFASTRSGAEEIWIANKDGSNPLQVTSMGGPQCSNPQWSPDGRTILFNSRRAGSGDLYLLQPDTGKLTRLTDDPGDEGEARWSRDGRSIYFESDRTGRDEVWRMPAVGGAPAQITRQGGTAAIESGDGFLYYAKRPESPSSIWRVPVDGGAEVAVVDGLSYSINFAVTARGLYFVAINGTPDHPSVDFLDFRSGQRSTLVRLDKPFWFGLTLSPNERSLVFSVVDNAGSNLMLVEGFR